MSKVLPKGRWPRRKRGQTLALLVFALPAFIGAIGLATDVGNFYYNFYKLQTAVDAAVLAGAQCLPAYAAGANSCKGTCGTGSTGTCTPTQTTSYFATTNGVTAADTVTGPTIGGGNTTISMTVARNVPYYFATVVGTNHGTMNVTATAQAGALSTAYNTFPIALQYCGTTSSSSCYTQYTTYNLTWGAAAPGNWGPVSASAASSVSLCATGTGCLPVDTGCSRVKDVAYNLATSALSRINAALSNPTYSADTPTSIVAGDPRVVTIPLVDWAPATGGSTSLNVYGFAEFFLTGVTKGTGCSGGDPIISGQFISAEAAGTVTSGGTADIGATAIKLIQ